MDIKRLGSVPSSPQPEAYVTGLVRRDVMFSAPDPVGLSGGLISFPPGGRTAWHTHPLGQLLVITAGVGRVRVKGGPVEEVRVGDFIWFEPGEKHWHGASPHIGMTHVAILTPLNGETTDWMEKVTDEEYGG